MKFQYLNAIRTHNPLIHNITNLVSANFTANGLLAIGASPMMAETPEEMAELAAISSAVVLNLGTPSDEKTAAMLAAGVAANTANVPVVLDPVAAEAIHFTAIRGNAGEMAHLAGVTWQAKGVDAGEGEGDMAEIVRTVAQKFSCIAIASGETDFVSDGQRIAYLQNGVALFPKVTASGCLLSAILGAFVAVAPREEAFAAVCEACTTYAVAGELAAHNLSATQSGTFAWRLLDELAAISTEQVAQRAHITFQAA